MKCQNLTGSRPAFDCNLTANPMTGNVRALFLKDNGRERVIFGDCFKYSKIASFAAEAPLFGC